ncbi:bifunctional enoyl-CoA hydratase/phosphate acetyltransferase [Virgibacillus sediminis]|uniref:Bifunctional enoyl-CoA hydratase/phosphate acetyltransferase n=1 Tax=Virgibacillus sediminis TaxID=202260 RepID=A0ABV7A5Q2_9BACI
MRALSSLKSIIPSHKKTVAVANAADASVLAAVKAAMDQQVCHFILVGNKTDISAAALHAGLDVMQPGLEIRHMADTDKAAREAVAAVKNREAELVMKGNLPTKNLLSAVLDKDAGLRTGKILSHLALFEIPALDRLVLLSDAALNIQPNLKEKQHIIQNAKEAAKAIGIPIPRIALLAPVETVNESMQSTMDAAMLTQMNRRGQISGCIIDGPLAFDAAISRKAAEQKGIDSEVAGMADVLVVPTIDAGNMLYKSFIYVGGAKVASIVTGAKAPVVLTSRADSADSKLHSLTLGLAVANKT